MPPQSRKPESLEDAAPGPPSDREVPHRTEEVRRLGFLVEAEARRALSESQLEGDPQRIADGWVRRFVADRPRAEEAMELYIRLGYEVCSDPVIQDELADGCEDCLLVAQLRFVTIYTRRPSTRPDVRTSD